MQTCSFVSKFIFEASEKTNFSHPKFLASSFLINLDQAAGLCKSISCQLD